MKGVLKELSRSRFQCQAHAEDRQGLPPGLQWSRQGLWFTCVAFTWTVAAELGMVGRMFCVALARAENGKPLARREMLAQLWSMRERIQEMCDKHVTKSARKPIKLGVLNYRRDVAKSWVDNHGLLQAVLPYPFEVGTSPSIG